MTPDKNPQPPRKRGAQPGNTNAIKHGLYARSLRFPPASPDAANPVTDLAGEIAFLRALVNHVLNLSADLDQPTVEQQIALLRVFTLASNTMARLVHNQRLIKLAAARDDNSRQWYDQLHAGDHAPLFFIDEH